MQVRKVYSCSIHQSFATGIPHHFYHIHRNFIPFQSGRDLPSLKKFCQTEMGKEAAEPATPPPPVVKATPPPGAFDEKKEEAEVIC